MAHRAEINDCENCNEKDVCEVSNMMNNYGLRCKMFSPYRPLTNADRIRAMTDEELADFLGRTKAFCCRDRDPSEEFAEEFRDWLKEEASE